MIQIPQTNKISLTFQNKEEIGETIRNLDLYSRIWIGQLLEIDQQMLWLRKRTYQMDTETVMTPMLFEIRNRILPNAEKDIGNTLHASYGIFSDQVDERAGIAYDIQQVIRYTAAWYCHPDGGATVDFRAPIQVSRKIHLPEAICGTSGTEIWMELTLSVSLQQQIIQDAKSVFNALSHGQIREMFSYYTNDKAALDAAAEVERYYHSIAKK